MAEYGEVYAEVDASVVNGGISTLDLAGSIPGIEISEGDFRVTIGVRWVYSSEGTNGFSGQGWFTADTYSPFSSFENNDAVNEQLANMSAAEISSAYFSNWGEEERYNFTRNHYDQLAVSGCTYML